MSICVLTSHFIRLSSFSPRSLSSMYSNNNSVIAGTTLRRADRSLGGFLRVVLELIDDCDRNKDGTSSGYKRLPSALMKCWLQIRVCQFSGRLVHLITWTQRFSSLSFIRGREKTIGETLCCTWSNNLECNSSEPYWHNVHYLTHCLHNRNFYLIDQK